MIFILDGFEAVVWFHQRARGSCDVPPLNKDGQSKPGSLWGAITEIMTHNTSHTRRLQIKCSESETLLQFKFQIQLQSFKRKRE
jgi:hypothetical protein